MDHNLVPFSILHLFLLPFSILHLSILLLLHHFLPHHHHHHHHQSAAPASKDHPDPLVNPVEMVTMVLPVRMAAKEAPAPMLDQKRDSCLILLSASASLSPVHEDLPDPKETMELPEMLEPPVPMVIPELLAPWDPPAPWDPLEHLVPLALLVLLAS